MKLETAFVIGNTKVAKVAWFGNIEVYEEIDGQDDERTLFFVQGDKVLKTLHVEVGCGQNMGYISDLTFGDPK